MTDSEHYEILQAVKAHFATSSDLNEIWGFGPVTPPQGNAPRKANCVVLHNPVVDPSIPKKISTVIKGESWSITLNKRRRQKFKLKFHGPSPKVTRRKMLKASATAGLAGAAAPFSTALASDAATQTTTLQTTTLNVPDPSATVFICPPPAAPPGDLIGGDAIFNWQNLDTTRPTGVYWGTIAYVASNEGRIKFPGDLTSVPTPNAAISCAHVLTHKDGTGNLRTYRHSSGISFLAKLPGWSADWPPTTPAVKWPDLAAANVGSVVQAKQKEVRGLGELVGVEAPSLGDVLAKYGASTGLTVARDIGMVWRRLPDETGGFQLIRAVSNQFSAPGDSGAAVVHIGLGAPNSRKLAGFVLAGADDDNEQYYLPALSFGEPLSFADLNAVEVDL